MRSAVLVILLGILATSNVGAQQSCYVTPQTTPTADFTANGDGTITHKPTGLMWKQCLEGFSGVDCTTGTASQYTWQAALQLADGHSFAGYDDWRLPNIKELSSIVETGCFIPAINLTVFPNFPIVKVWTSSPSSVRSDASWVVDFSDGRSDFHELRDGNWSVLLVRDIQ
jgi:hypothetical protein